MSHFAQSAIVSFFWVLSAMFLIGIVGSALVVILTSIEDAKELRDTDKPARETAERVPSVSPTFS